MIGGIVGILDQRDEQAGWHLADVGGYPLVTFCGAHAPEPMSRRVRAARTLKLDQVCAACVDVWAVSGGGRELRRTS